MKIHKTLLIITFPFLTFNFAFSQDITADTTLANEYLEVGVDLLNKNNFDSSISYFEKSSQVFEKHKLWHNFLHSQIQLGVAYIKQQQFEQAISSMESAIEKSINNIGENNLLIAKAYHKIGFPYYFQSNFNKVLFYWNKELEIYRNNLSDSSIEVGECNINLGAVYEQLEDYPKALSFYKNAIYIFAKYPEYRPNIIADCYENIGMLLANNDYSKDALFYFFKSIEIRKKLNTESIDIGKSYNNIGIAYFKNGEIIKSIDYYYQSLEMYKKFLGEKHILVGKLYVNLGLSYLLQKEFEEALNNYQKALEIQKELLSEKNPDVAVTLNNIGQVYFYLSDFDKSLEYLNKSLQIEKDIHGEEHSEIAKTLITIGQVFYANHQNQKALECYTEGLKILKKIFDIKNRNIATAYINIALLASESNDFDNSLNYYQKVITTSMLNNNDTTNHNSVPPIKDYINWSELLEALQSKAQIFANDTIVLEGFEVSKGMKERNKLALRHYQACDTLINQVRKEISMLSDKIALGEKANQVYNEATQVCISLSETSKKDSAEYFKQLAFEFSEKNKSSVLLESLAGAEAMKFAGIPDSLLEKEHDLQIDIALYKRLLSEQPDSAQEDNFRSKLFNANRSYDSLMLVFEIEYPAYHQLKYGQSLANVEQLQQVLDKNTAIISYQESDSVLTVFYITQKDFEIHTVAKHKNFHDWIDLMRANLSTPYGDGEILIKSAYKLYGQLFPFEIGKKITNLIIIPDGAMSLLPFETLHTTVYQGEKDNFKALPYLVSKYNISYSYSANLFYRTFPKQQSKEVEITPLNDWLALAPVFDDSKIGGATFRTREMLRDMEDMMSDSTKLRGMLLNGDYITPLPGTESEVKTIYNQFENNNKKALAQLHGNANETFVKSGELENYRYLHFASHGIVNTQKPELSGIILAQDSTSAEDGILYTGEIYNLRLHADLTVLSACETGLGEIKKGEGLIGLTRALLYAGSKNIIVSLWKVADNSTSQLMVDFYDNLLKDEKSQNYSEALRKAKLKMIAEGKYSHPFYWSPFILVGK